MGQNPNLFIDEFQDFFTYAFPSILAETRENRFGLTLAHQYIDQLIKFYAGYLTSAKSA